MGDPKSSLRLRLNAHETIHSSLSSAFSDEGPQNWYRFWPKVPSHKSFAFLMCFLITGVLHSVIVLVSYEIIVKKIF